MPEEQSLFTVLNHHMVTTAEPPNITDEPNQYRGYFENAHGDQAIFVYDWVTKEANLLLGDAGWKSFRVVNGNVQGLSLAKEELAWLGACWQAVTLSA